MANYKLTRRAVQDLREIWNYPFDEWSEQQADKYYYELLSHCSIIAQNPTLGNPYDHLVHGLRGLKVNKHIVFYRQLSKKEIEVARILHDRMDIKSHLSNE